MSGGSSSWTMGNQSNMFPPGPRGGNDSNFPRVPGAGVVGGNGITLKLLLSGEEVKYLFGAEEILLNQLKQQTGTNITLTEPGPHERVLSIPGPLDSVFKAFGLVCRKLCEFVVSLSDPSNPKMLVLRLAVHSTQCGMVIGKHGAKIKEIKEMTGANINVSQESLPESNERTVEIIGTGDSCLQSTFQVLTVLQENPPRGEVVPYVPKSLMKDLWKPIILAGDKAYIIENGVAILAPPELVKKALAETPLGKMAAALPNFDGPGAPEHMNPLALMTAISTSQRDRQLGGGGPEIVKVMKIADGVAPYVMGKNGSKVGEIRQISGANVTISTDEEISESGERMRSVIIKGTAESALLAQFLIQSNIDIWKKEQSAEWNEEQGGYQDEYIENSDHGEGFGSYNRGGPPNQFFQGNPGAGRGGAYPYPRGGRRSPMDGRRGNMQGGGNGGGRVKGRRR